MGAEATLLITSVNRQRWWNSVKWDESSYCSYARVHAGSQEKSCCILIFIADFQRNYKKKRKYFNDTG